MQQLAMAKIMLKINSLPFLPHVVNRVIELADDPRANTQEICEAVGQDQVLASKVLRLVNSAYYGLPRKVGTISEAVTILGMQTLKTLVIGASVMNALDSLSAGRTRQEQLWRHSVACATASKIVAAHLGIKQKEHAFVAGLLHDIGKIILYSFMAEEYRLALKLAEEKNIPIFEAEKEVFGFTHADIGKFVAEKWNLPVTLIEPIGGHHNSLAAGNNCDLVKVVYLANVVSEMSGYSSEENSTVSLSTDMLAACNLTYNDICGISEEIKGKISIELL